ncbi:hypothetical protein GJ496_004708 [Pomphorhynchus laevis]|nr:hypothetical protein GJ496_004708 [Pomphorhynchus laevis]
MEREQLLRRHCRLYNESNQAVLMSLVSGIITGINNSIVDYPHDRESKLKFLNGICNSLGDVLSDLARDIASYHD